VVATVLQLLKLSGWHRRVLVEGQRRASLQSLRAEGNHLVAESRGIEQDDRTGPRSPR
jgi:hypothetical protein